MAKISQSTILVLKNLTMDKTFRLERNIVIGRGKGDLIYPSDGQLSKTHVRLQLGSENQLSLVDLNSTNGTFVDGEKIPANQPVMISPGQEFRLGNQTFVVNEEVYRSFFFPSLQRKKQFLILFLIVNGLMTLAVFLVPAAQQFIRDTSAEKIGPSLAVIVGSAWLLIYLICRFYPTRKLSHPDDE